jgi:microcystin-dependent protein
MDIDVYIGTILLFPYNFTPANWSSCDGQILTISQYQALYALIGNIYGGSASQGTFALPNLNGAQPLSTMKYYIALMGIYPTRS